MAKGPIEFRLKEDLLIAKPLDLAEEQEVVQLVGAEVECPSAHRFRHRKSLSEKKSRPGGGGEPHEALLLFTYI